VKLENLKLLDGLQWFFGPRWRHDFASSLKKSSLKKNSSKKSSLKRTLKENSLKKGSLK